MTTVLHADLRALGYCNRGSREFFRRHGLDFGQFLRHGIEAEQLEATNDAMAQRAVEYARDRERAEGST